jgi:hypothetical protein
MEMRELWVNPGIVGASCAASGSCFKLTRRHVSLFDCRMVPFGNPTLIGVRRISRFGVWVEWSDVVSRRSCVGDCRCLLVSWG